MSFSGDLGEIKTSILLVVGCNSLIYNEIVCFSRADCIMWRRNNGEGVVLLKTKDSGDATCQECMGRNVALDILKVVMAFMVVGLHAKFFIDYGRLENYLTQNGLFRIAVPVFLIINGFYFSEVLAAGRERIWIRRVAVLYFVWMLLYSYYWFFQFKEISFFDGVKIFFVGYFHLWYMLGLIGAASVVCLIRRIKEYNQMLVAGGAFCFGVAIQYAGNYHFFYGTPLDGLCRYDFFHRNFLFFAFPFFYVGLFIRKYKLQEMISVGWALFFTLAGVALLLVESWLNYINPKNDGGFDNFFSLIVAAPAIFILVQKARIRGGGKILSMYASSIYFVHIFFVNYLQSNFNIGGTWLAFLSFFLSVLSSVLVIFVNKRLPIFL